MTKKEWVAVLCSGLLGLAIYAMIILGSEALFRLIVAFYIAGKSYSWVMWLFLRETPPKPPFSFPACHHGNRLQT